MNSNNNRVQDKSKVMVMEKTEVICISSDDENEKINDKQKPQPCNNEVNKLNFVNASTESNNKRKDIVNNKRKISEIDGISDAKNNGTDKRIKTEPYQETNSLIVKDHCKQNDVEMQEFSSIPVNKKIVKPQLIIKEKKNISLQEQDIFPSFLSLCLQKRREPEMEIIVNKLKRRYEQMNPIYAKSEAFQSFLNAKRNAILSSDNMIFQYIMDVKVEMKSRANKNSKSALQIETGETNVCKDVSLSSKASSSLNTVNNIKKKEIETDEEDFEDDTMDANTKRKFKKIKKVMNMCSKRIKILEESEVNFDDDDNSNFIKLERYKERMVKLYNEYCRITGDNQDAGRSYLRPKHLNTTQISSVDNAITSFINAKITKRNRLKKSGRFTDDLIFPDYRDILKCVSSCNERNNLGLSMKKQSQIAKKAFTDLGEHLQRARRIDYWDTFSLCLENKQDDPALKDQELAQKLRKNYEVGQQKLTQIFQEFVKKQEKMNLIEDKADIENDDNEDSNVESKDEDENSEESDEDDEDINNDLEDDVDEDEDEDEDEDDDEEDDTDDNDSKTDEDKRSIISSESNKNEIQNNAPENEIRLENDLPNTCKDKDNEDVLIASIKEVSVDSEKVIEKSSLATGSETSVIQQPSILNNNDTKDEKDEIMSLDDDCSKTMKDNKPILRVRSFAKHPTTWEDNKQKFQNAENESSKEVIDLTNDVTITKVSVPNYKVKTALLPSKNKKYKTLLLPAHLGSKSIISVKNITNNYLKFNPRKIDINKPPSLKPISVVKKVVDLNSGNTIIHLPHSSDRQNISTKENNNETIKKQTVVHLLIPTEVYNKNSIGVSVKKNSENKPK